MADRCCSLCGSSYTDKKGHNYNVCVSRCSDLLEKVKVDTHSAVDRLITAFNHYHEALIIQKQDWWRKKVVVEFEEEE